jgi:hypothetical protein
MDPTANLAEILDLLEGGGTEGDREMDRAQAIEHLRDLANWLERGGALPAVDEAIEKAGYTLDDGDA